MKQLAALLLFSFVIIPGAVAQTGPSESELDIMATTLFGSSLTSIPVKVTVQERVATAEIGFPLSSSKSGQLILSGTPYDSMRVQFPDPATLKNQFGNEAKLSNFRLLYGVSENEDQMNVLPPSGCTSIQIPETGRLYIKIGALMSSENDLRGTFTGTFRLDCRKKS